MIVTTSIMDLPETRYLRGEIWEYCRPFRIFQAIQIGVRCSARLKILVVMRPITICHPTWRYIIVLKSKFTIPARIVPVPLAYLTFGGWKKSGFGDLKQHGPDGFRFYTRTKTITARWPSGMKEGASLNFKPME
jgi:hypothetical protein